MAVETEAFCTNSSASALKRAGETHLRSAVPSESPPSLLGFSYGFRLLRKEFSQYRSILSLSLDQATTADCPAEQASEEVLTLLVLRFAGLESNSRFTSSPTLEMPLSTAEFDPVDCVDERIEIDGRDLVKSKQNLKVSSSSQRGL